MVRQPLASKPCRPGQWAPNWAACPQLERRAPPWLRLSGQAGPGLWAKGTDHHARVESPLAAIAFGASPAYAVRGLFRASVPAKTANPKGEHLGVFCYLHTIQVSYDRHADQTTNVMQIARNQRRTRFRTSRARLVLPGPTLGRPAIVRRVALFPCILPCPAEGY